MWTRCLTLAAALLLATAAIGQEVPVGGDAGFAIPALAADLPGRTLKRLQRAPDRFVEDAAELILGFGDESGIGAEGIERAIAVERAHIRAREMRRLLRADLDDDLTISRDEISVLIAAARAGSRGRLLLAFQAADRNSDGRATLAELQGFARQKALEELSVQDAELLRAFMGFDLDRNGRVDLGEVRAVARALRQDA